MAPGAFADLLLVDGDPLRVIVVSGRIDLLGRAGEMVVARVGP